MNVKSAKLKTSLNNVVVEFVSYDGQHIEFRFDEGDDYSQPGFSISNFWVGKDGYNQKGKTVRTVYVKNQWDFKEFLNRVFI